PVQAPEARRPPGAAAASTARESPPLAADGRHSADAPELDAAGAGPLRVLSRSARPALCRRPLAAGRDQGTITILPVSVPALPIVFSSWRRCAAAACVSGRVSPISGFQRPSAAHWFIS